MTETEAKTWRSSAEYQIREALFRRHEEALTQLAGGIAQGLDPKTMRGLVATAMQCARALEDGTHARLAAEWGSE